MKKLIFLFLILLSCEKDEPQQESYDRTCWECRTLYTGAIPPDVRTYCDKTDIGLSKNGEITESEIRLYEAQHTQNNWMQTKCRMKTE